MNLRAPPPARRAFTPSWPRSVRGGRQRGARLMEVAGICGVRRRKWLTTTTRDRARRPAPALVERHFSAPAPNELWVADLTYLPTGTGFLYLAVVLDVFRRSVVGWAMETHLRTELVLAALHMALGQRRPEDVIHHSDQGTPYPSIAFGTGCQQAGVRPSRGSVGDCFANAMAESLFATLECALLDRRSFKTQVEARMAVFDFLAGWDNPPRRHSALGYQSPIDYQRSYGDNANQTLSCAAATRPAGPPKNAAAGAVHSVAAADPKPLSFPAPPSDRVRGGAEKLDSDQH